VPFKKGHVPSGNVFQKGQSGNPGGRSKAARDVEEAAREHSAMALTTLAKICGDPKAPPAARISAATVILDRGYGRPAQTIHATHRHEIDPETVTDAELARIASNAGAGDGAPDPSKMH
jgi:hypothetical protein